ncbi:MAG TPA: GNAT family N-acetyltransferase [Chthoniobacteraceae bacterium]|nr:GNAT family N-acetyltransferase [Chthoniobacteraceae bacterium]
MISIRQANAADATCIVDILREAALWLEGQGIPMWAEGEIMPQRIIDDVSRSVEGGTFYLAELDGESAGVFRLQLEDERFWPDVPAGESVFVHRLAVRRKFAGRGISTAILDWVAQRGREMGRKYLRLDCEASRPRLRAIYERFGFRHHSDRQVGPYYVARYEYPLSPGA